jgi:hypothetical protein
MLFPQVKAADMKYVVNIKKMIEGDVMAEVPAVKDYEGTS